MRAVIPRRSTLAGDRGVLIVNYAMHKQKTLFFFLLQVCTPALAVLLPENSQRQPYEHESWMS